MTIVPLFGHAALRATLGEAFARGALPAALLLQGQRGIGKQRLAIWVARLLLCEAPRREPCDRCEGCRFAGDLKHPDLHWFFPLPRPKDTDPALEDVRGDYAEAVANRAADHGLYESPSGSDGIYVATVRAIVQQAVMSPAMARRKVFIIGDAERMVPQEGSEYAANAFLKLLEEPPANTQLLLTSSEPGALLPTVRSRVVSFRVPLLSAEDVRSFLEHPTVANHLAKSKENLADSETLIARAGGAPGRLLDGDAWKSAKENAERLLNSLAGKPAARYEAAWAQASTKARGAFADSLDALTVLLHQRALQSVRDGAEHAALGAARAVDAVELAKERVAGNVSPPLVTANLLRELHELLA